MQHSVTENITSGREEASQRRRARAKTATDLVVGEELVQLEGRPDAAPHLRSLLPRGQGIVPGQTADDLLQGREESQVRRRRREQTFCDEVEDSRGEETHSFPHAHFLQLLHFLGQRVLKLLLLPPQLGHLLLPLLLVHLGLGRI